MFTSITEYYDRMVYTMVKGDPVTGSCCHLFLCRNLWCIEVCIHLRVLSLSLSAMRCEWIGLHYYYYILYFILCTFILVERKRGIWAHKVLRRRKSETTTTETSGEWCRCQVPGWNQSRAIPLPGPKLILCLLLIKVSECKLLSDCKCTSSSEGRTHLQRVLSIIYSMQ